MTLRADLAAGASALGLALAERQLGQLLAHLDLLQKWNKVYNLTAVRDPAEMLTHHLLDSLAAVPPLLRWLGERGGSGAGGAPARLLDVGSGGGLPGVVFAICCPALAVDCIDTVAKKAAFIQQAAGALQLPNLRGLHGRVEQVAAPYDVIACRAFAALPDFTAWSAGALADGGAWMALKGKHPADEIAALPPGVRVFHVEQLTVPGLQAERCVVWMQKAAAAA